MAKKNKYHSHDDVPAFSTQTVDYDFYTLNEQRQRENRERERRQQVKRKGKQRYEYTREWDY